MNAQLTKKLNAVAKSANHLVRKLTNEEASSLIGSLVLQMDCHDGDERAFFPWGKGHVMLRRRPCGQYVAYTF